MTIKEIFTWIGGAGFGISAFVALFIFTIKHFVKTTIDKNKERYMQDYKHEIDKFTRAAEHDFQRRIHDFGLYSTKRHEKYSETFRLLHIAYSATVNLVEVYKLEDFLIQHGEEERNLINYLTMYNIEWEVIQKVASSKEDYTYKKTITDTIVQTKFRDIATEKGSNAQDFISQNKLYFSSTVEDLTKECVEAVDALMYGTEYYSTKLVSTKLEELKKQMKEEMSVGYYKHEKSLYN